jgi:acetyl esterase/lipase
MNMLTY